MSLVVHNISSKHDFFEKKEFISTQSIFGIELFIDAILYYYIYGELVISGMTKQEVFNECLDMSCELIRKGAINSKFKIAEELLKPNNIYLNYDKHLAEFLIHLASYENSSSACIYMSQYFSKVNQVELSEFWIRKSLVGCIDKLGECLNIYFNRQEKKVELRY